MVADPCLLRVSIMLVTLRKISEMHGHYWWLRIETVAA